MSDLIDRILHYHDDLDGHRAGTLSALPLSRLEWYLQTHFQGQEVRTAETGCGASSIVFAHYAAHHTAYCYDDRSETASSVSYAQNFRGFRHDRVKWVYGPTQRTIFEEPLEEQVDVVLIDGPHGYPFPELEYFAFYQRLNPGGILIVDDIHIPTINNLYRFLLQDDSFRSRGVTLTTAYFERTHSAAFNMEGDDWWLQRFNVQSFPSVPIRPLNAGVRLPICFLFDRKLVTGAPILTRGFSLLDTPPISEGGVSTIDLRLAEPAPDHTRFELDIEPVCAGEREGSGVTVFVNAAEVGSWVFDSAGRRNIVVEASTNGKDVLTLELRNHGLKIANQLKDWVKPAWFDARLPNFCLHSLTVSDSTLPADPTNLRRGDGSIVTFDYAGKQFSFFVDEPEDLTQSAHTVGQFSDLGALEMVKSILPTGAVVLDVGAHVGNHTVYFEKAMRARRVVPIEPNPQAQFLLRTNCYLNGVNNVDLSYVERALGSHNQGAPVVIGEPANSGDEPMRVDGGAMGVQLGDDVFPGQKFDLIRINVPGMELEVLAGLSQTIDRSRPLVLVEVNDHNRSHFMEILKEGDFDVIRQDQMHSGSTSFLVKSPDAHPLSTSRLASNGKHAGLVLNDCWAVAQSQGRAQARGLLWRRVVRSPSLLRERSILGALRRLHGLGPSRAIDEGTS